MISESAAQQQQAHAHREQAKKVFTEMLTAVQPEVKDALVALYHLVQAEQQVCRCSCPQQ